MPHAQPTHAARPPILRGNGPNDADRMWNKVPEVTAAFWFIKVLATTVGETGADFLASHINPAVAYGVIGAGFVAALGGQLRARRYIPWLYWLTVVLVSVVGTLLTDGLTDALSVSLFTSTAVFSVLLAGVFAAWYWRERTLSIHTIVTRRREAFYWAAILCTFALGTAAGDLSAEQLALGYEVSTVMFVGLIAGVMAVFFLGGNAILTFWIAYILTRPLGASLGDLLSQPVANGGFGFGATATSVAFLAAILTLVGVLSVAERRRRLMPRTAGN